MRSDTKRLWVRNLERAQEAYAIERRQLASSQNVITRYMVPLRGTDEDVTPASPG